MKYEVEQKFVVDDLTEVEARLNGLGASIDAPCEQVDRYYNHPARDFAVTDEALRLRQVGQQYFITYKGPKLDATTKTRREIELPLGSGETAAGGFAELLQALGFRPVAEVRKRRRVARVEWEAREIEIALDEVTGLGTFVELELTADANDLDTAKASIAALARELRLSRNERRSYLEMLLARKRG